MEDPQRSYAMAPKLNVQDQDQDSDEDWFDMANDNIRKDEGLEKEVFNNHGDSPRMQKVESVESRCESVGFKEHAYKEDVEWVLNTGEKNKKTQKQNCSVDPVHRGPSSRKSRSQSPGDKSKRGWPVGPNSGERGALNFLDLNDSPSSSGCFPFVEDVEKEVEDYDLGEEDVIEQAISDEIDRKKRQRKKESRNSRNFMKGQNQNRAESNSEIGSKNSRLEEINHTLSIGEELGINWNGFRELVDKAVDNHGGKSIKC
ncbi:hypothetical protein L2E82_13698 [Cichorium intybus]|uniref:Uncharacterized protein n=1 Tax=Cichorium intybus TaxID=13427 RepID=A0ACB9EXD9_CICIN|nr:hypothetical protein L2E82_13698 [Cichorium intybus]